MAEGVSPPGVERGENLSHPFATRLAAVIAGMVPWGEPKGYAAGPPLLGTGSANASHDRLARLGEPCLRRVRVGCWRPSHSRGGRVMTARCAA